MLRASGGAQAIEYADENRQFDETSASGNGAKVGLGPELPSFHGPHTFNALQRILTWTRIQGSVSVRVNHRRGVLCGCSCHWCIGVLG